MKSSPRNWTKEDIQMANTFSKRYSTSLLVREVQVKVAMRQHCDLVYPPEWLKLRRQYPVLVKTQSKEAFLCCWRDHKLRPPLAQNSLALSTKAGQTLYALAISLLGK